MGTLSTLGEIQIGRTAAFPAKLADNPVRALTLGAVQRRNAVLDAVFYDVDIVTDEETPDLAFWLAREGAILWVPPSGRGRLRLFLTAEAFLEDAGEVGALAVAGVGSSALGAAAFARNIADALDAPVAAVVSGYGLADVLTEALGGFFWFGGLNSLRHLFEPLDTMSKRFTATEGAQEFSFGADLARASKDTQTLIALLTDARFAPKLLVGHSKGNLVISEALYAIVSNDEAAANTLAERCRIVTISAKIGMPKPFCHVLDIMGEWDWFGALNSRPDIQAEHIVPHAWHSTNPAFPMGMGIDVTETLKRALPKFESRKKAAAATSSPSILDMPQRLAAITLTGGGAAALIS